MAWGKVLTIPGSSFLFVEWGEKNSHLMELGGLNEIMHGMHLAVVAITVYFLGCVLSNRNYLIQWESFISVQYHLSHW